MERREYQLGTVPANQSSTFQSASRKRHYHGRVAFACGRLSVPTYKELKAQLAELVMKAAAVRQQEYDAVLADIRTKVVEFGYTEREIFGSLRGRPRPSRLTFRTSRRQFGANFVASPASERHVPQHRVV